MPARTITIWNALVITTSKRSVNGALKRRLRRWMNDGLLSVLVPFALVKA